MFLKRKRSSSEFSSSTATNSPPQKGTFHFGSGDALMAMNAAMSPSRSHLHSRTMKRFRNGRPSDDEVHGMFLLS